MSDVMERLTRANPVPTGEASTAEERHEAELLLESILADGATAADTRPARRIPVLRRVAPAAALLAVLALAVVVVVDLVSSEKRTGGIVERAVAAVSQEDVIFAITERGSFSMRPLEPGVDPQPDERVFRRSWVWGAAGRVRFLAYRVLPGGEPGRLRGEVVSTPERVVWYDARGDRMFSHTPDQDAPEGRPADSGYPGFDPFSDPGHQLREHVENDRLRVAGRTTVRGRTAYRLVSAPHSDPEAGIERETVTYLVDARTFLPLEVRNRLVDHDDGAPGDGRKLLKARIEYLRYEPLPVTDETKRLLEKGGGRRP